MNPPSKPIREKQYSQDDFELFTIKQENNHLKAIVDSLMAYRNQDQTNINQLAIRVESLSQKTGHLSDLVWKFGSGIIVFLAGAIVTIVLKK